MYRVIVDGEPDRFSETLVYIKLAANGCYVPCDQNAAEGFCVKLPYEYLDDAGELIKTVADTVFALSEGALTGAELVASVEEWQEIMHDGIEAEVITAEQYEEITGEVY